MDNKGGILIRAAEKSDMARVRELICELAVFEREPDAVEISIADLERDGFGEFPLFHCLVAEVNGQVEGMALFYPRYSTWKGETVHLEDLIVSTEKRGMGIGNALFREVIRYGAQKGVKRIEWAVLNWNMPAIAFYEKNGARVFTDWDVVQLDEAGIKNYMKNMADEGF